MKRENDPSAPSTAFQNWYPGHMAKALREIKQKLNMVDIVLEIRDARVPLVSGNPAMDKEIGSKCKLIILNKMNLADPKEVEEWDQWFTDEGIPALFVNCFDKPVLKKVVSQARKIVENNRKKTNPDYVEKKTKLKMMIVGLPNTGKSTIINQLANKNATKVADKPGQTRIQQWIEVDKDVELLDTPGVMPPSIANKEHGLWLSAIHAIPDDITDEEDTAIFVINHLLKVKSPQLLERYKLESLEMSINDIFMKIATLRGCLRQGGIPDIERVHKLILADFRKGDLGRTCFSAPPKS